MPHKKHFKGTATPARLRGVKITSFPHGVLCVKRLGLVANADDHSSGMQGLGRASQGAGVWWSIPGCGYECSPGT